MYVDRARLMNKSTCNSIINCSESPTFFLTCVKKEKSSNRINVTVVSPLNKIDTLFIRLSPKPTTKCIVIT